LGISRGNSLGNLNAYKGFVDEDVAEILYIFTRCECANYFLYTKNSKVCVKELLTWCKVVQRKLFKGALEGY
jgi:hypothetical protein